MANSVPTYLVAIALSLASQESLRPGEPPRAETYRSFRPGEVWKDTDGNRIEAHGGGMLWENGIYYWFGTRAAALLYNGGQLWFADGARHRVLPDLPSPVGEAKMGWYHCIPGDVCGDEREEAVLYDPWDASLYIFTPRPLVEGAFKGYRPGPRQYNARLMD